MPIIIQLCLETIKKYNPNTVIADSKMVVKLGGKRILKATRQSPKVPHHKFAQIRGDLVRYWLLKTYGGVWLDADYICFRPINLLNCLEEPGVDLVTRLNEHRRKADSNVIASFSEGQVITSIFNTSIKLCRKKVLGSAQVRSFSHICSSRKFKNMVKVLPAKEYSLPRMRLGRPKPMRVRRSDIEHECCGDWTYPVGIHLGNVCVKKYSGWSRERLMSGRLFLSFLFRKALL